jgi:hypothetical protein
MHVVLMHKSKLRQNAWLWKKEGPHFPVLWTDLAEKEGTLVQPNLHHSKKNAVQPFSVHVERRKKITTQQ